MTARTLMILSCSIIMALGTIHLIYTFWGRMLTPRDPAVHTSMVNAVPILTTETSVWRVWVGVNASHSIGLLLFGLIFGYLAVAHATLLFQSQFLLALGLVTLTGYAVLGWVYWFSVPLIGIATSLAAYVASVVASRT